MHSSLYDTHSSLALSPTAGCLTGARQKQDNNSHSSGWLFRSHTKSHSQSAPFSYEYIFEEGKLPFLAETKPVRRKIAEPLIPPSPPLLQNHVTKLQRQSPPAPPAIPRQRPRVQRPETRPESHPEMFRKKSLRKKERPQQPVAMVSNPSSTPASMKTTDKLKRALSLSGIKSHSSSRNVTPQRSPRLPPPPQLQSVLPSTPSSRGPASFLIPPTPKVQLPTPEPSPEPTRSSFAFSVKTDYSSNQRASWTSTEEDQRELFLMQYTAMGRLTPSPVPSFGGRRDKALATLGITETPMTPPYTPAASNAPSVHEQPLRRSSARIVSQRQSLADSESKEEEKQTPPVPQKQNKDSQETPRAQEHKRAIEKPSPDTPIPRPILRRKTSKFTEHIDSPPPQQARLVQSPIAPSSVPPVPVIKLPRTRTVSNVGVRKLSDSSRPLKRSESMRTPSPNPAQWDTAVYMAEARPVVAMGSAKLVEW